MSLKDSNALHQFMCQMDKRSDDKLCLIDGRLVVIWSDWLSDGHTDSGMDGLMVIDERQFDSWPQGWSSDGHTDGRSDGQSNERLHWRLFARM